MVNFRNPEVMVDLSLGIIGTWHGYKNSKKLKETDVYLVQYRAANNLPILKTLPFSVRRSSVIDIETTGEHPGQFTKIHFIIPDRNRSDINFKDTIFGKIEKQLNLHTAEIEVERDKLLEENFVLLDQIERLKSARTIRTTRQKICSQCKTEITPEELIDSQGRCPSCGAKVNN